MFYTFSLKPELGKPQVNFSFSFFFLMTSYMCLVRSEGEIRAGPSSPGFPKLVLSRYFALLH